MIIIKKYLVITILSVAMISAVANATTRASNYVSANTYNNLYPYMNNTMRTQLNPGVTPSQSGAQINTLVRTNTSNATTRNVVPRSATSTNNTASARSGVPTQMHVQQPTQTLMVQQRPVAYLRAAQQILATQLHAVHQMPHLHPDVLSHALAPHQTQQLHRQQRVLVVVMHLRQRQ